MSRYLMDTNILLRYADTGAGQHSLIVQALEILALRQNEVVMVPQTVYEFWSVATCPADKNGLGWTTTEVSNVIGKVIKRFLLLPDTPDIFENWLELVTRFEVKGKQVHDARIVAAMQTHNVATLLTLNTKDFARYAEIEAVHPEDISDEQ